MRYQVEWSRDAESDLASLWADANDRGVISSAANRLDRALAENPFAVGESREGNTRIAFATPIAIVFEVYEDDRKVVVIAVWAFRTR